MSVSRDLIYITAAVIASPAWVYSLLRTGKWRTDWRGRFGNATPRHDRNNRPTILIHAVSVGEVNAIRELVARLHDQTQGQVRIVISTTTNTGTDRARSLFEPIHTVVRYPFDLTRSVRRFFDEVKPDLVALTELEVWPTFVDECAKRHIPVGVINGRLSPRGFKRYQLVKGLLRSTFDKLTFVAAQTQAYADRFIAMGVPAARVIVTDTMKWDTAKIEEPNSVSGVDALAQAMGIHRGRPIIVCGSTGPDEEKMLAEVCPKDAQLILVPRKPERFDEATQALQPFGPVVRRTAHPDDGTRSIDDTRLFLLDTMGELRKAYAMADVAIVGRSFLGLYGSDMIEPIALGKPTIIGPHHSDFADTVDAFVAGGGLIVTDKPGEAAAMLLADREKAAELAKRGREVILSRQGATQKHTQLLLEHLPQQTHATTNR